MSTAPSERIRAKANRLLLRGRVHLAPDGFSGRVVGEHDTYVLTKGVKGWRCSCPAGRTCAHILAVQAALEAEHARQAAEEEAPPLPQAPQQARARPRPEAAVSPDVEAPTTTAPQATPGPEAGSASEPVEAPETLPGPEPSPPAQPRGGHSMVAEPNETALAKTQGPSSVGLFPTQI